MDKKYLMRKGIFLAILAAALYAINAPFSKLLLNDMPPTLMAGFLYIGVGLGIEHIFLRICATIAWRGKKQCLLRNCSVYRHAVISC